MTKAMGEPSRMDANLRQPEAAKEQPMADGGLFDGTGASSRDADM